MSKGNNIDKLVKKAYSAKSHAFSEADWHNASAYMAAQKKAATRKRALYLSLLLLILVGIPATIWLANSTQNTHDLAGNSQSEKQDTKSDKNQPSTPLNNKTNLKDLAGKGQFDEASHTDKGNSSQTDFHDQGQSNNSVDKMADGSYSKSDNGKSGRMAIDFSVNGQNDDDKASDENNKRGNGRFGIDLTLVESGKNASANHRINAILNPNSGEGEDNRNGDLPVKKQETGIGNSLATEEGKPKAGVNSLLQDSSSLGGEKDSISLVDDAKDTDKLPVNIPNRDSLEHEKRQYKGIWLFPYIGVGMVTSELTGINSPLLSKRVNEEASPIAPDIGFGIKKSLKNNFYIKSGLGTYQLGENAEYSPFSTTITDQVERTKTQIVPSGSRVRFTDSVLVDGWNGSGNKYYYTDYEIVIEYDTNSITEIVDTSFIKTAQQMAHNNRYQMLEIPMLLGYEMPIGKWSVNVDAGLSVGLLVGVKGYYPDLDKAEYAALDRKNYRFANLGVSGGVGVSRTIANNWELSLHTLYRTQLNPIQKDNAIVSAKYQTLGLRTGLTYKF
ncbi:MAG: outer membrane beta-barrel protein [Bacteroidetes bacterium]|nr:outer membrane beta-barrel protein [Bacteroidota bacterium]